MATQAEVKTDFDWKLLLAIYEAGVRRGSSEAVSFDWGERPTGKHEDELVETLYYHLNEGRDWANGERVAWETVEAMLAQGIEAGTAETTEIGSVHESPVRDSECAHNQGESD